MTYTNRDSSIDVLRFIGLSFIILAHVTPPYYIFNIRCFDVPMMVFISGLVYSQKCIQSIKMFLINRFKRLIIPVYLFLTLYFIVVGILYVFNFDFGVKLKHVIESYLLLDGIGYVWIIRVFLLVALITPLLLKLNKIIRNEFLFIIICFFIVFCLNFLISSEVGMNNVFIREYVYYLIGYSIIFWVGVRVKNLTNIMIVKYSLGIVVCLVALFWYYHKNSGNWFIPFNNYKYPPQLIYIVYGIFISIVLYLIFKKIKINNKIVSFIGSNTIWIYLYHIPIVQFLMRFDNNLWGYKYLIVYTISIFVCYVHIFIVNKLSIKHRYYFLKYLKG